MTKRALIAMSGGVDSSVAALLTLAQGYECAGAMMKLHVVPDEGRQGGCCTADDAQDARAVARRLGIAFYVFRFIDCFTEHVIDPFVAAYRAGETPNPCIACNRYVKFGRFLTRTRELDMDCMVTGHYARIEHDAGSGRYLLKKGLEAARDQSYVLYAMTQEQLSRTLLPLGALRKDEVRALAAEHGLINAAKRDSQDICFVPDGDYAKFITQYTETQFPSGSFVDADGNELGRHRGIIHYTVGQRKGLGLSLPAPLYVRDIRPENNTVVLCRGDELFSDRLTAKDINLIAFARLDGPIRAKAKIRYRHEEQPVTVIQEGEDTLQLRFDYPQRAITRGQAVVLYDGDVVLGGGTIV